MYRNMALNQLGRRGYISRCTEKQWTQGGAKVHQQRYHTEQKRENIKRQRPKNI